MKPNRNEPVVGSDDCFTPRWRDYFERTDIDNNTVTFRLPGGVMTFTGAEDGTVTATWEPR